MSCIAKTLELKGDNPILKISDHFFVEGGGNHKGYDYIITFVRDHRCGYVAIPPGHPLDNSPEDDYYDFKLNVHGGITFNSRDKFTSKLLGIDCNDRWLGFDAIHSGDSQDYETAEKYGIEVPEMLKEFKWRDGTVKGFNYMKNQCIYLINQLIDMQPN